MSLKKNAVRRVGLLTGASLVATGLSAAVSIGLAAIPSAAAAQSVCTPTPASGAGANTVTYTTGFGQNINCTATGALTINKTAGSASSFTVTSTGGVTINLTTSFLNASANFTGVTGGGVNFITNATTNSVNWRATGAVNLSSQADTLTFTGVTNANNTVTATGSINFADGNDTLNLESILTTSGTIDFGAGADHFNASGAIQTHGTTINFGSGDDVFDLSGTITKDYAAASGVLNLDFGSGTDTFNQSGVFVWNGGTISNLEAFNNSGTIILGGQRSQTGAVQSDDPDGDAADKLVISSGVFTGSGDSRIVMEAKLNAHASQIGCATPTVSECVDFTGASTAGSTMLLIRDLSFSIDGGTLNTIVTLVQGSSAAENFVLDPNSDYYGETPQGQAIRKPMVAYRLAYDAANKRHVLVGAPTEEVEQASVLAAAGQEIWRATTGSWFNRQADLRATPGGLEPSAGFWARVGGQDGERDAAAAYELSGLTFDYDLSHKQRIAHLVFGADMVGGAGWVAGASVGFVRSDIEFDVTPTEAAITGYTGGVYASFVSGPLFVDATANLDLLHVKADTPDLGLGLDVPMKFDMKALGGQVEAGWRIAAGSSVFIEPLAGITYVVARFDDTAVPGGSGRFDFEDAKSLRLGAGARLGMDGELAGLTASYSLTGRYWTESEGEAEATITTLSGSSTRLLDAFTGNFGEVSAALNLFSENGGVSGFANLGGKFGDGYQAVDGSLGVRVRW